MTEEVKYEYEEMSHCLHDVNKLYNEVGTAISDMHQIVQGLHESFKSQAVADAQSAAYVKLLKDMEQMVQEPLKGQHDYVWHCMEHAQGQDAQMAHEWDM